MGWQVVERLRPHPNSVGQARAFCTRRLSSVLSPRADHNDAIADIATVASELVTNAVVAGATDIQLCLSLRSDQIRVEVVDDAAGMPNPGNPGLMDMHGRGLVIIGALAQDWGVIDHGDAKSVWAEVAVPPLVPGRAPPGVAQ